MMDFHRLTSCSLMKFCLKFCFILSKVNRIISNLRNFVPTKACIFGYYSIIYSHLWCGCLIWFYSKLSNIVLTKLSNCKNIPSETLFVWFQWRYYKWLIFWSKRLMTFPKHIQNVSWNNMSWNFFEH